MDHPIDRTPPSLTFGKPFSSHAKQATDIREMVHEDNMARWNMRHTGRLFPGHSHSLRQG